MKIQSINAYNNKICSLNKIQKYTTQQKIEYNQPSFKSGKGITIAKHLTGLAGLLAGSAVGYYLLEQPVLAFIFGISAGQIGYYGVEELGEYLEKKDTDKNKTVSNVE